MASATPVTIITGFLGSGKTTLILNLIPQLPVAYKLALLKNEFGDLAIDSQLASSSSIGGVKELLNGCICCNLVGQLGDALRALRQEVSPDRIVIETSGSAFPATIAMEVNRLARETGEFALDGVVVVIDVENWKGYEDTSYTARMQARYTDLIVFNKWEFVDERQYEDCLDRVGDLEVEVVTVKSEKGRVDKDLLLGLDSALAQDASTFMNDKAHSQGSHGDHQNEVEVISVVLTSPETERPVLDLEKLESFLYSASKDEIYRIKAVLISDRLPRSSEQATARPVQSNARDITGYILNWAFGRWTFTHSNGSTNTPKDGSPIEIMRMTIITARYEAEKWAKQIQSQALLVPEGSNKIYNVEVNRLV